MNESRIDPEWITLNAFRDLLKIASKGDLSKSTYNEALEFGGALYPALLGRESSVLRRVRESDTTMEYRQRARLQSRQKESQVTPIELLLPEIAGLEELLSVAAQSKDRERVDQLKRRLKILQMSRDELQPQPHSEHQLIFRDAFAVARDVPTLDTGKGYRDFRLPDEGVLRVRVLHPDKPEQISGADIIYERHSPDEQAASLVAVQYKIWEKRVLHLSEPRMQGQIQRLRRFVCENELCKADTGDSKSFRFPHCAAFLRPTDRLQRSDQHFMSSGEHLPICKIDACTTLTDNDASVLKYSAIRNTSVSGESFEYLFSAGKLGSRILTYDELTALYMKSEMLSDEEHVVIYAQEFPDE